MLSMTPHDSDLKSRTGIMISILLDLSWSWPTAYRELVLAILWETTVGQRRSTTVKFVDHLFKYDLSIEWTELRTSLLSCYVHLFTITRRSSPSFIFQRKMDPMTPILHYDLQHRASTPRYFNLFVTPNTCLLQESILGARFLWHTSSGTLFLHCMHRCLYPYTCFSEMNWCWH